MLDAISYRMGRELVALQIFWILPAAKDYKNSSTNHLKGPRFLTSIQMSISEKLYILSSKKHCTKQYGQTEETNHFLKLPT